MAPISSFPFMQKDMYIWFLKLRVKLAIKDGQVRYKFKNEDDTDFRELGPYKREIKPYILGKI